jgi:hypothetical protein
MPACRQAGKMGTRFANDICANLAASHLRPSAQRELLFSTGIHLAGKMWLSIAKATLSQLSL